MPPCQAETESVVDVVDGITMNLSNAATAAKDGDPKTMPSCSSSSSSLPSYTMAQVSKHTHLNDAWLIYKHQVLDVSKWVAHHPGGEQTLMRFAGGDATDEIRAFHNDAVLEKRLPHFVIGSVSDKPVDSELVQDFRKLGEEFVKLGYFAAEPGFYTKEMLVFCALYSTVWALVLFASHPAAHLLAAVLLGIFWQQFSFVGHDTGHRATSSFNGVDLRRHSSAVTFCLGISVAWWNATHNVHHAVPNTVDCDPDIAHLPVFALDTSMFGGVYNRYHKRVMPFDWLARNVFVPYQQYWYYPIMSVAKINLYVQSLLFLLSGGDGHGGRNRSDALSFGAFFVWLSALVACVPGWYTRVAFFFLSHAVAGTLNVQITLSHFSRPMFGSEDDCDGDESSEAAATEVSDESSTSSSTTSSIGVVLPKGKKYGGDFFTRNVLSSLDVDCHPLLDRVHGGLQFQTLHHCYPRIARHHLRKTMPLIESLCRKHGLPYEKKSFWECNVDVWRAMAKAGGEAKVWSPMIYESMCAHG